ncbi:MAG: 1-acyl-sn-glycerol-3-phosphate acyltransferase [Butyrivibrio sp.]|nr:1-acyl-sn-glycerol-3-phosphate acyltransferase [Butyrivibrio sp.]
MFLIRWLIKLTGIIPGFFALGIRKYFVGDKINTTAYKGPLIIVQNHKSFMDFPLIVRMFALRRVHVVVSETLYAHSGFLRFILKVMGVIKADRFSGDLSFVNESIDILNKGGIVLIYPEGKIETSDEIYEFKRSAALISVQSGVPILPIYHEGRRGFLKRDKCIIGSLMYPQEYVKEGERLSESADRLNRALYDNMCGFQRLYKDFFFEDGRRRAPADKMNFAGRFVLYTAIAALKLTLRPRIKYESGLARLMKKRRKRMIVIGNHTWWLDGPMLCYIFAGRKPHCVIAKDVAVKNKFLYNLQKNVGAVFLDRTGFDWAMLKKCIDLLENDGTLIIFPEGHFRMDGSIDEFHTGPAMLSALTGAPVVPVYIDGIYKLFRSVKLSVGNPVFLRDYYAREGVNPDTVAEVTGLLHDKLTALKEDLDIQKTDEDERLRRELERQHTERLKSEN